MPKPPPNPEALMLDLARNHVAAKGYPQSDFAMIALIHALQGALPQARPVEVHQPGKAALAREPEPTQPATGACHLACPDAPTGWRLYVNEGWRPVCSRHMGGAKAVARRLNRELGIGAAR